MGSRELFLLGLNRRPWRSTMSVRHRRRPHPRQRQRLRPRLTATSATASATVRPPQDQTPPQVVFEANHDGGLARRLHAVALVGNRCDRIDPGWCACQRTGSEAGLPAGDAAFHPGGYEFGRPRRVRELTVTSRCKPDRPGPTVAAGIDGDPHPGGQRSEHPFGPDAGVAPRCWHRQSFRLCRLRPSQLPRHRPRNRRRPPLSRRCWGWRGSPWRTRKRLRLRPQPAQQRTRACHLRSHRCWWPRPHRRRDRAGSSAPTAARRPHRSCSLMCSQPARPARLGYSNAEPRRGLGCECV